MVTYSKIVSYSSFCRSYCRNSIIKYTDVTGLIITKLDGTAKGGVIFQLAVDKKIPVRFIGIGEAIDDLQTFRPKDFINALLDN